MDKSKSVEISMPDYFTSGEPTNIDVMKSKSVEISIPTLEDRILNTRNEGGLKSFDLESYTDILGTLNVNANLPKEVLDEYRALSQSAARLWGAGILNTGTTLVGGAISGVGALAALPRTAYSWIRSIWDENADEKWNHAINDGLGGWLMELGHTIEQSGREAIPIYQTQKAMKGGFGGGLTDATWWATNGSTVASAVASFLPVLGQTKLLSMAGNLLKGINIINKAGQVSKIGKALQTTGNFLNNRTFQYVLSTISGAHLDTFAEIAHGWQEQYDYAKSLGFNDDEANKFASVYASEAYKDGIGYGLLFNAIEMHSMLKHMNTAPTTTAHIEKGIRANINKIIKGGSKATIDTDDIAKKTLADKFYSLGGKTKDALSVMINEGFEEMRVDFALQQGEEAAKTSLGIEHANQNRTTFDKLVTFAKDSRNWDSFIWGAIGGGLMYGGRGMVEKVLNGKAQQEYEQKRATNIINTVQSVAKILEDANGDMNLRIEKTNKKDDNGNVILDQDGNPEIEYNLVDPFAQIMPIMMATLGDTATYGYINSYLEGLSKLSQEEQIEILGGDKSQVIDGLRREFGIMSNKIQQAKKLSWGTDEDNVGHSKVALEDYMYDYYKRQLGIIDTMLAENNIVNDTEMKALESLNPKRFELEEKISQLEDDIKNRNELISYIDDEIKNLNRKRGSAKGVITKINNRIKSNQVRANEIENEINQLEESNSKSADIAFIASKEEGTQLDIFTDSIIDNTDRINQLYQELIDINDKIDNDKALLREKEIILDYINTDMSNRNSKKDPHNEEIEKIKKELDKWKSNLNEVVYKQDAINAEYDRKREKIRKKYTNLNIEELGLNALRKSIALRVLQLETSFENRDSRIIEELKQREELRKKAEENEKKNEKERKEAEKRKKESERRKEKEERSNKRKERINDEVDPKDLIDEDDDSRIVKSNTDDYGIEYTSSINQGVKSVKISNRYITIGTKLNLAESTKTIEDFDIITANGKSVVSIKFENDDTIYTAKEIDSQNPSFVTDTSETIKESIDKYRSKYSSHPAMDGDGKLIDGGKPFIDMLINDFFNGQDQIDQASELYRTLSSNPKDLITIEQSKRLIGSLEDKLRKLIGNEYKVHDIMEIRSILKTLQIQLSKYENQARLRKYFDNLIDRTKIGSPNGDVTQINNLIDRTLDEIVENLSDIITINNNKIRFNRNSDVAQSSSIVFNTVWSKLNNLQSELNQIVQDEAYNNEMNTSLNKAYNTIFETLKDTYRSLAITQASKAELIMKLNKLKKDINDSNNPLQSLYKENPSVKNLIESVRQYADDLHNIVNQMLEGKAITAERFDKLFEVFNTLHPFANVSTSTELANMFNNVYPNNKINATEAQVIWNTINDLLTSVIDTHQYIDIYNNVVYKTNVSFQQIFDNEIPFAIKLFTNSSVVEAVEDFSDEEIDPDVAKQFSENQQFVIKYLHKILSKIVETQFYTNNAKIPFEVILDYIYQQPDGANNLSAVATNLWDILSILLDPNNQDRIENIFNQANIDKEDSLYNAYKNIIESISLDDVDSKYIVRGSLKTSYINNFTQTHKVRNFDALVHKGLRRLTPKVYDILSNEKYYDYLTKQFKTDKIKYYGETFTPKEIIETLKKLGENQIVHFKPNDDASSLLIYVKVGNKDLVLDEVGLQDSDTYGGFTLSKTSEKGITYYESAFGIPGKLSTQCTNLIKYLKQNDKNFNAAKEFYRKYTKYRLEGTISEHSEELTSIINNLAENESTKPLFNAIKEMLQYGHDVTTNPITEADLEKCYTILSPAFYAMRDDMLDNINRHGLRIEAAYSQLNTKLRSDFNEMQKLIKSWKEGNTNLVISSLNKSPISFNDTKTVGNINKEVEKTTYINGEPSVDIIIKQEAPIIGFPQSISSLTRNEVITGPEIDTISGNDHHWQIYARIRGNSGVNGYSLIPTIRGTLNGTSRYHEQAQEFVTDIIHSIINDPFDTIFSNDDDKQTYKHGLDVDEVQQHNIKHRAKLNKLSDHIIVDSDNTLGGASYFNVDPVFQNKSKNGKTYYKKVLHFITSVPTSSTAKHRSISFANTIECIYDENGKLNDITVYRQKIDTNTRKIKGKRNVIFNKRVEYKNLIEKFDYDTKTEVTGNNLGTTYRIKIGKNSEQDLKNLLREVFVKHMLRSVNTKINTETKAITYGRKILIDGETEFEAIDLNKTYKPFTNGDEYSNYQDFLIETGAIQSTVTGIKTKNGETITNYEVDSIPAAMYFEVPGSLETEIDPEDSDKLDQVKNREAKNLIRTIINNRTEEGKSKNWFKQLGTSRAAVINNLKKLGVIPNNTHLNVSDIIYDWLEDLYANEADGNIAFMTEEDLNRNINVNASENQIAIAIMNYDTSIKQIRVNNDALDNIMVSRFDIGGSLIHESLHKVIREKLSKEEYNEVVNELNNIYQPIGKDINELNLEEFNSKYKADLTDSEYNTLKSYNEAFKNVPEELVTYALTNNEAANIFNRIKTGVDIKTKKSTSLWRKILETLLKFIGIDKVNNKSLEANIINTFINKISNAKGITSSYAQSQVVHEAGDQPSSPTGTIATAGSKSTSIAGVRKRAKPGVKSKDVVNNIVIKNVTADTEIGYTPTLTPIENNIENLLKIDKKLVSFDTTTIEDFKSKYYDDTNTKIC